ncbi:psk2p [Saccharomyces arboricola H-6]|uniref:non-specific serine/threonine protein kinase n=1 Tax=Saccharomyces arboricola (strain H-6 / AS 2.3317 / CBS 10644) TaxID=1160507 RepID=J8Q2F6_SACAR|nr:psk2p [Saccharomyces arboricola H-6]
MTYPISVTAAADMSYSKNTPLVGLSKPPCLYQHTSSSVDSFSSTYSDDDRSDLVAVPNESPHAFSYNPISPNSLGVRLTILRRSLEIMVKSPDILQELNKKSPVIAYPPSFGHTRNLSETATLPRSRESSAWPRVVPSVPNPPAYANRPVLQRATSLMVLPDNDAGCKIKSEKSELENLLFLLNLALENNSFERASDLHMLSLLNIKKLNFDSDIQKSETLKKTLLDSLAEPFFENYKKFPHKDSDARSTQNQENQGDIVSLADIKPQQDYSRILHPFTSAKNCGPEAIFTCSQQYPWNFKAANDLACLTFGISKNVIKALTLLDLIHTDSRKFVLEKIMNAEDGNQEIVFTGETVPIVQPNSTSANNLPNLIWASLWAKRKNGMLVCVFEKTPCDYVDVMLNLTDFSVDSILDTTHFLENFNKQQEQEQEQESSSPIATKKTVKFANEIHDIGSISHSLSKLIEDVRFGKVFSADDDLLPLPIRVANHVNKERYFTLSYLSENIPCAVTTSVLENEIKLKIHSLPYQAGLFVVDSHSLNLISFNKSVAKNMFGLRLHELASRPITKVVPSLANMISYVNETYPVLNINLPENKGLVLTEHFFRKIEAEMHHDNDSFYTSIGLDGRHKDGNLIKVDIQLRILNTNVILLWITHSRDVVIENYTTVPSQLPMLKETEIDIVGSRGSSNSSSKKSSEKISVDALKKMTDLSISSAETLSNSDDEVGLNQVNKKLRETCDGTSRSTEPNENNDNDDDMTMVDDPELKHKIELTKMYTRDKSKFVKDDNFNVDEKLIMSIIEPIDGEQIKEETNVSDKKNPGLKATYLTIPESNIGSQKRTKKFSDFTILQVMGEGAYGKVNLCIHNKEHYIVVIKMIFKERILVDTWVRDRKLGTIPSEIQIMATLNKNSQENILKLLDFFEDDDYYYIETPVHGETGSIDLFDVIEFKKDMVEHEAKLVFKQVVASIKHLHDQGIVHRDIKDENVIVDCHGFVKLIDFGSAAYIKSGPFDVFVGTMDYAAPEVLGGSSYKGKPQDIWALGVLLYTIIYKENPYYNIDEILEGELRFDETENVSKECISLIKRILTRDVDKRPTIDDIYEDKWLKI